MSIKARYLTKSRYKMAIECPTKLYYTGKKEYANSKLEDPFLEALAKGGFQVGALAQCYYPGGVEVIETDHAEALKRTEELLKNKNVIIFEAALSIGNLFVRVDILEKSGNNIKLIEVKSVSADPETFKSELWAKKVKKGTYKLLSGWRPYIYDVAFQAHVAKKALPNCEIHSFLMCADKSKTASIDGLNQKFQFKQSEGRGIVQHNGDVTLEALGKQILCRLNIDEAVKIIHAGHEGEAPSEQGFEATIEFYSKMYSADKKIPPTVSKDCKNCEFRASEPGKKNGFNECWKEAKKLKNAELDQPFCFDVWNYRSADKLLESATIFMKDIDQDQLGIKEREGGNGLSQTERQWLQIEKVQKKDPNPFIDTEGLEEELKSWKYPLNFIDFETCTVAIPFHKGRSPYEQVAFQFSHHVVHANGTIEHANQYLNAKPGAFPNFEFVRTLKNALEKNQGTIFRYSHHENTVLCQIHDQLSDSTEPDRKELQYFIKEITRRKPKSKSDDGGWIGPRNMVDLCEIVQKYYYHPHTKGSNSIKAVLPAILGASKSIQAKYSKPIYGTAEGVRSINFKSKQWVNISNDGSVKDPYSDLEPIFDGLDAESLDLIADSDSELNNGGAAMTAYAYLQFVSMSDEERRRTEAALLRYCELDTFAMVLIWEYWASLMDPEQKSKVS